MSSKEAYDSIVDVSNDYLSFVFDHGYYMNPSYVRKNGEPDFGFRFFITIKKGLAVKQVPFSVCRNIEHKIELAKAYFRKYRTFPRMK